MSKLNLSDFTIVIPFRAQSSHRIRNLRLCVERLVTVLDTAVLVVELSPQPANLGLPPEVSRLHIPDTDPLFNRSKATNAGVAQITTPYFITYDSDILIPAGQYALAANWLREGKATMALPFANRIMHIPIQDVEEFTSPPSDQQLARMRFPVTDDSFFFVGGANALERAAFIQAGMMDEGMRGFGYEEEELFIRLLKLGHTVLRTEGVLYHMEHERPENLYGHGSFSSNKCRYNRMASMNPDQIRKEVATWAWVAGQK